MAARAPSGRSVRSTWGTSRPRTVVPELPRIRQGPEIAHRPCCVEMRVDSVPQLAMTTCRDCAYSHSQ